MLEQEQLDAAEIIRISEPLNPRFYQAGFLDLNSAFCKLPQPIIESCGKVGAVRPRLLQDTRGHLKEGLMGSFNLRELTLPNFDNKPILYPILSNGHIALIAKTKIFTTLLGKHQLGLNRFSPLPNPHNRGEHSIYMAVKLVRTIDHLYAVNPELLMAKLREDYAKEGFDPSEIDDENLLSLTINLATAAGMTHDLMTPAGGDAVKYFLRQNGLNMDEEHDLAWFFSKQNTALQNERDELRRVLEDELGLTPELIEYMIACVQGKSDTLLGELVNPAHGDEMETDREAYTELDNEVATIFDPPVPDVYLPDSLPITPDEFQLHLATRLVDAVLTLLDNPSAVLVTPNANGTRHPDEELLPVNLIDCSDKRVLSENGELICTDPIRLAWAAVFRDYMTIYHYAGAQMLGLEAELQDRLQELWTAGTGRNILTRDNLLAITDDELFAQLCALGDEELTPIIDRAYSTGGVSRFAGAIVAADTQVGKDVFKRFPLKPKPGFDSLVFDEDEVINLGEFIRRHPESGPAQFFSVRQEHLKQMVVDVNKI